MVISLERGADLHMAQLTPLPLIVSCFSRIHIGFTFHVLVHLGSPGQRDVKRVCVCVSTVGVINDNTLHKSTLTHSLTHSLTLDIGASLSEMLSDKRQKGHHTLIFGLVVVASLVGNAVLVCVLVDRSVYSTLT